MNISTTYEPGKIEGEMYHRWETSGFFNPDNLPDKRGKPFSIIMPPPNANGALHLGHALFVTLEDIMIRYQRMRGRRTLWLPGADHAGFETQTVYDKKLEKEGRNRRDIPREELYQEMYEFTQHNKKVMEGQLRKLGASCDWSREKFTLDADIIDTVYDTFKVLLDDGLAYRENRIVNWCTKHQTTLSDLEIKYVERKDPLYYIRYGPITLATVRLETKFGDTAVAVNPKDKRYKHLVGTTLQIKTLLGPATIKVIADEVVDPTFGTGAVKVTPAHDPNDFEMWQRHRDEIPPPRAVIDQFGRIDLLSHWPNNKQAQRYHGKKILEARALMEEDMQKDGLMVKIDPNYVHSVATCYKCGTILEPRILPQWFVAMTKKPSRGARSLRDAAVRAVKEKKIIFIPARMEKIYMHWMRGLRDWNISRQITWGIRIPIWYCGACEEKGVPEPYFFSKTTPPACPHCGTSTQLRQDPDVFDTWFSSGQWPYAALGFPRGRDYKTFYPTDVMETGWDILFFWVARMIMLGLYRTKNVPFRTVYLHGLVRDKDRRKMSKSKGNVIDPLGVAELYGTDAVRMALVIGTTAGNDPIISEEKIRGYRNFANKIWNASRFLLLHVPHAPRGRTIAYSKEEKRMRAALAKLITDTTRNLDAFQFHHAAERLYHFFWHYYADKVIEYAKPRLASEDARERARVSALLFEFHHTLLRLLHPFMPFVTEAVWQHTPGTNDLLMAAKWPFINSKIKSQKSPKQKLRFATGQAKL